MPKAKDISGEVFGRLTAVSRDGQNWVCRCECGNLKSIYRGSLTSGATKSCGCLHKEALRQPPGYIAVSHLFARYQANASMRSISFEIDRPHFERLIAQDCYFCGAPPALFNPYCRKGETEDRKPGRRSKETIDRAWIKANGVDRLHNALGYTVDNCMPCCTECNMSKGKRSAKEFIEHARRLIKHQQGEQDD